MNINANYKIGDYTIARLLVFLIPIFGARFQLFGTSINRYIILAIFVVLTIQNNKITISKQTAFRNIYMVIIAFIIPILIHKEFQFIIFQFTDILFPVYIGYLLVNDYHQLKVVNKTLISTGMLLSFLAILECITGINVINELWGFDTIRYSANGYRFGFVRAFVTFSTSINLGLYLGLISTLTLYMFFGTDELGKHKYFFAYIIMILALIMTFSRAPIIITLLFHLIIFINSDLLKKKLIVILIILGCILIGAFVLFGKESITNIIKIIIVSIGVLINPDKYATLATELGIGSAKERQQLFRWVFETIKNNLLFGNGFSSGFSVAVNQWKTKTSIENYYLAILHATGFIGLAIYLRFLIAILVKFKPKKLLYKYINFSSFSFIIFMIFFLTILTVTIQEEGRIFYIILGTTLACVTKGIDC